MAGVTLAPLNLLPNLTKPSPPYIPFGAIHKGRPHREGEGKPKADIVREVAWIYYCRSSPNANKGIRKIVQTSFMYGPFHIAIPTLCSPLLPTRQIYLGAPSPSTMGFKFKVNIDLASSLASGQGKSVTDSLLNWLSFRSSQIYGCSHRQTDGHFTVRI